MIKKFGVLVLAICLLLMVLSPAPIQAQGGLSIINSSVVTFFPYQLSFSLSARSDVNITDIRLCYTVDRAGFAEVISEGYVEFAPATTVDVSWTLEMVKIGGLPPGTSLEYWWRVSDDNGNRVETVPAPVQYDDIRYSWQSLSEEMITIYWYEGDNAFAGELMSAAQQALEKLAEDTGASLEKPVKLYIYASQQDLLGALIYPTEWTGGVNLPQYHVIAIGIAPSDLNWGKTTIAHELTHQVIYQVTANPYNSLPRWLDEGLAMYEEGALGLEFVISLDKAIANGELISVQSLCSEFSAISEQALLSYAESYSLVEYLINTCGQDKMLELLETFEEGSSYDAALESVYGFDMDGLDGLWRGYLTEQYQLAGVGS